MHNILRLFITTSAYLLDAKEDQVDLPGSKKAIASIWYHLPSLHREVLGVAEDLKDDSTRSVYEPHPNEEKWLNAIIDELGSPSEQPMLNDFDSWATLSHGIAWFAFCLRDTSTYATDKNYGKRGFEQIREMLAQADEDEKVLLVAGITQATIQFDASEARYRQITATYDALLECVQNST